jgi:hypothetical protein
VASAYQMQCYVDQGFEVLAVLRADREWLRDRIA